MINVYVLYRECIYDQEHDDMTAVDTLEFFRFDIYKPHKMITEIMKHCKDGQLVLNIKIEYNLPFFNDHIEEKLYNTFLSDIKKYKEVLK